MKKNKATFAVVEKSKGFNVTKAQDVEDRNISYSFSNFNRKSISIDNINFSNFYENIESSRNAVSDFFKNASEFSKYKMKELMSNNSLKDIHHLNHIYNPNHINRIEKVLQCYGYNQIQIDNFEKDYYEYEISDGKRVIWHKVENIMEPLFIDCNHLICNNAARRAKMAMNYSVPSSFEHLDDEQIKRKDTEIGEDIMFIINQYNEEEIPSQDLIDLLKDIIDYDKKENNCVSLSNNVGKQYI